jgi:hypothetical protein
MRIILLLFLIVFISESNGQSFQIISPFERGEIENGKPVGKWEFSDSVGVASFSLDQSNGKLIFAKKDTSTYMVKLNNYWQRRKLDSPCRFYGSYATLFHYYIKALPAFFKLDRIIWLVFDVNESGYAESPTIVGSVTDLDKKRILEVFNGAPNTWIPGVFEGKNVRTRFCIPIFTCVDECVEIKKILQERSGELGKSLFPIGFKKYKKTEPNYKSMRMADLYFATNQIIWSKDDSKILIKITTRNGSYTNVINSRSGKVEKKLFGNELYLVKCLSNDCSNILINYSPFLEWDFVAEYSISEGTFQVLSDRHDILPIANSTADKICVARRENNSQQLVVINKGKDIVNYSSYFSESEVKPLEWIDDSRIICSVGNSSFAFNQLEIFNIENKSRTKLAVKNAEFVSLSPKRDKILVKEKDPTLGLNSKLVIIDVNLNLATSLFKSFKTISNVHWLADSDRILYSTDNKSKVIDTKTLKEEVINKVGNPFVSNDGKKMVYTTKNGKFYISDLNGENLQEIIDLTNN